MHGVCPGRVDWSQPAAMAVEATDGHGRQSQCGPREGEQADGRRAMAKRGVVSGLKGRSRTGTRKTGGKENAGRFYLWMMLR